MSVFPPDGRATWWEGAGGARTPAAQWVRALSLLGAILAIRKPEHHELLLSGLRLATRDNS